MGRLLFLLSMCLPFFLSLSIFLSPHISAFLGVSSRMPPIDLVVEGRQRAPNKRENCDGKGKSMTKALYLSMLDVASERATVPTSGQLLKAVPDLRRYTDGTILIARNRTESLYRSKLPAGSLPIVGDLAAPLAVDPSALTLFRRRIIRIALCGRSDTKVLEVVLRVGPCAQ